MCHIHIPQICSTFVFIFDLLLSQVLREFLVLTNCHSLIILLGLGIGRQFAIPLELLIFLLLSFHISRDFHCLKILTFIISVEILSPLFHEFHPLALKTARFKYKTTAIGAKSATSDQTSYNSSFSGHGRN